MTQFIKYILLFLISLFLVDQFAGLVLDYIRDKAPDGRYYKASYTLNESEEEILILGSSRGEMNFATPVFEEILGKSSWNASRGGQSIPYFRAVQEALLKRHTPKVVILNLETYMIETTPAYDQLGFLRPYAQQHPEIRPILNNIGPYENINLYSRLYAYNSSYYYLFRPFLKKGLDGSPEDKGWKPKREKFPYALKPKLDSLYIDRPLNMESKELFDDLIQQFSLRNCVLILVVSPDYGEATISSPSLTYYEKVAKSYQVPLFNFSEDSEFNTNADYFSDHQHLNRKGATVFSKKLAKMVRSYLNKQSHQTQIYDHQAEQSTTSYMGQPGI